MDENYMLDHGRDEIEFENIPGSLIPVYQLVQEFGNYSSLRTNGKGVYHVLPRNGEHHLIEINPSEGILSIIYTSPKGKNQIKDRVPKIRNSLKDKLKFK